MQDKSRTAADAAAPLPDFTPVPRMKARHDGWTPERQRGFIKALAETGSVTTAARMVNMAHASAYALRQHPDAAEFAHAWDAALALGVQILRDEAFDRAMNGQLVPIFSGGRLIGYRRVKSDRLLMYMLRHYGQDANGRRVTLNYFAGNGVGAAAGPKGHRVAATTPPAALGIAGALLAPDTAADLLQRFEGVPLDEEAQAAMLAVLDACANRNRTLLPQDDPDCVFVHKEEATLDVGVIESGMIEIEAPYEPCWQSLGDRSLPDVHEWTPIGEAALPRLEATNQADAVQSREYTNEEILAATRAILGIDADGNPLPAPDPDPDDDLGGPLPQPVATKPRRRR